MLEAKKMEERMTKARSEFRSLLGCILEETLEPIKEFLKKEIEDYTEPFEYITLRENLSEELQDWKEQSGMSWGA